MSGCSKYLNDGIANNNEIESVTKTTKENVIGWLIGKLG
jgi:hypothetical protein